VRKEGRQAQRELRQAKREERQKERQAKQERRQERQEEGRKSASGAADETGNDCTPGYSPCLPPASDYDCAGGTGDGPEYAQGPIDISGADPYDLDNDGDGIGCES
jgi:hypothetical protein